MQQHLGKLTMAIVLFLVLVGIGGVALAHAGGGTVSNPYPTIPNFANAYTLQVNLETNDDVVVGYGNVVVEQWDNGYLVNKDQMFVYSGPRWLDIVVADGVILSPIKRANLHDTFCSLWASYHLGYVGREPSSISGFNTQECRALDDFANRTYQTFEYKVTPGSGTAEFRTFVYSANTVVVGHGRLVKDITYQGVEGEDVVFIQDPSTVYQGLVDLLITDGAWTVVSTDYAGQEVCAHRAALMAKGAQSPRFIDHYKKFRSMEPSCLVVTPQPNATSIVNFPTATPTGTRTATPTAAVVSQSKVFLPSVGK